MSAPGLRVVWAVVKREYLQRVRSKWFLIATLGAPLLFTAVLAAPFLLSDREGPSAPPSLVVLDRTGALAGRVVPALEASGWRVRQAPEPTGEDPSSALLQAITDDELDAFLVLDEATLAGGPARLVTDEEPSSSRIAALRQAVSSAVVGVRVAALGGDPGTLLATGGVEVDLLTDPAEAAAGLSEAEFVIAYGGAFLLYFTVLFYAVAVMRSVLEEKTSRVVEIVISSMRPIELMLGKILGVGAVGLTQVTIWVTAGILIGRAGLPLLIESRPELAALPPLGPLMPGGGTIALFLAFFVGGYFIYSAMYAAIGAMTNSDQEAQQAQSPMIILMIVPVVVLPGVIDAPGSAFATGMSLVPFFAPVLMFARAAAGAAPVWQVALSLGLMAVTLVAVSWLAGRIYRVGILMAGKRPTPAELWRWVRAG